MWIMDELHLIISIEVEEIVQQGLKSCYLMYIAGYKCPNIDGTFAIDALDSKKVLLTLVTTFSLGDKPTCDVDWGDNSDITSVEFDPSTTMIVEHIFLKFGVYIPLFTCSDEAGNFQRCPVQNAGCSETEGMFDDFFKSFSTPLKTFVQERLTVKY